MRTVCIKKDLYKFDELSDEAKEKAIENLYDLNVDHEWWDFTYDDAENIGLKITSFDLDRYRGAEGGFLQEAYLIARAIIENHGPDCETYKTAKTYLDERNMLVEQERQQWNKDLEGEEYNEDEADTSEIDEEFLKSLLEDYAMILQKEYDYLTSAEAIIETIQANEYEFTADGSIY